MLLSDLRGARDGAERTRLAGLAALAGTLAVRRKADDARRTLAAWRARCERPVLSVSGGKDSTLLLLLAHEVDQTIPVVRADGPVPLSDRAAHVAALAAADTAPHESVPYAYDIAGVLAGDVPYPAGLKQRTLFARFVDGAVDGYALGLRAQESRGRLWNARRRGALYQLAGRWVCTPLAWWTAEEVVGWLVATDRLPLNPVYTRTYLLPDLNRLRDATWLPNQASDAEGYREWLAYHYPEHVADYDRAVLVFHRDRHRYVRPGARPEARPAPTPTPPEGTTDA